MNTGGEIRGDSYIASPTGVVPLEHIVLDPLPQPPPQPPPQRQLMRTLESRHSHAPKSRMAALVTMDDDMSEISRVHPNTSTVPSHFTESCCFCFLRRRCCCCLTRHNSYRHTISLRKQMLHVLQDPDMELQRWQREWLQSQALVLLEQYEVTARTNERRFVWLRRFLIFFTVLLPALVLFEKTPYISGDAGRVLALFIAMAFVGLINNFLTLLFTDFQYLKRTVLFDEAKASLHSMLNNYLTCTQRYGIFRSPCDGFRTFARDMSNLRVLVKKKENFLRTGSREQDEKSNHAMVEQRRQFRNLFDPITVDESNVMLERGHRRRGSALRRTAAAATAAAQNHAAVPASLAATQSMQSMRDLRSMGPSLVRAAQKQAAVRHQRAQSLPMFAPPAVAATMV